jgi:hypothetical protein
MNASMETPVQPPELSAERLAQMRTHLLDEVERDARQRKRRARPGSLAVGRRRRVLVLVAAVLAVTYAVPAVAQEQWWWMGSPNATVKPVSQVVTVGKWRTEELMDPRVVRPAQTAPVIAGDVRWVVQAFMSKHRGLNEDMLCLALSPDRSPPGADLGGGGACGFPVHGLAPRSTDPDDLHWVGYSATIPGRATIGTPKFVYGLAAAKVHTVELEDSVDGVVIRVPTHAIPDKVGLDARFWIVAIPPDQLIHTIVPRDEDGDALERWQLPTAQ